MTLNAAEEESIEAIKKWWDDNGKQLIAAVIVVFGGYGGWSLWQNTELAASEMASDLYEQILEISLLEAGESTTLQERSDIIRIANELMESHSDSVYAQYGALFASQQHVTDNNLDAAEEALDWILENPQTGLRTSLVAFSCFLDAMGSHFKVNAPLRECVFYFSDI